MKTQKRNGLCICSLIALVCLLGACATYQARSVKKSGFLGDYSMLKPGGEGRALLVYIDTKADIKAYSRILMDPVKLYASQESSMSNVSKEDRQKLLNYADAAIREQLAKDYVFVQKPGPGVMRLRVALTEAGNAHVIMDTISTIVPIGLAVSGLKAIATGSWSFVGSAGVEVELLDSQSDTRLVAAVDRQVGGKVTGKGDKFDEWRTVKNAIDLWAERLQKRLAEARAK